MSYRLFSSLKCKFTETKSVIFEKSIPHVQIRPSRSGISLFVSLIFSYEQTFISTDPDGMFIRFVMNAERRSGCTSQSRYSFRISPISVGRYGRDGFAFSQFFSSCTSSLLSRRQINGSRPLSGISPKRISSAVSRISSRGPSLTSPWVV